MPLLRTIQGGLNFVGQTKNETRYNGVMDRDSGGGAIRQARKGPSLYAS
jgi:hypothetical protein